MSNNNIHDAVAEVGRALGIEIDVMPDTGRDDPAHRLAELERDAAHWRDQAELWEDVADSLSTELATSTRRADELERENAEAAATTAEWRSVAKETALRLVDEMFEAEQLRRQVAALRAADNAHPF
ncbi:hypothetical protein [Stackebrandtia soli]|uniref:hypothetical protein n=1 Tax=Stackebrandtia soli TaxID=1892856 RepID=UPI0039EAC869